jgi:hypothetical protein
MGQSFCKAIALLLRAFAIRVPISFQGKHQPLRPQRRHPSCLTPRPISECSRISSMLYDAIASRPAVAEKRDAASRWSRRSTNQRGPAGQSRRSRSRCERLAGVTWATSNLQHSATSRVWIARATRRSPYAAFLGDRVPDVAMSPLVADAIARGTSQVGMPRGGVPLPPCAPLVGTA